MQGCARIVGYVNENNELVQCDSIDVDSNSFISTSVLEASGVTKKVRKSNSSHHVSHKGKAKANESPSEESIVSL